MTIQECYRNFGGDIEEVKKRLPSEALINKFIVKFLDDRSFGDLSAAMGSGSREEAFRAAHTLKGVCSNLSLNKLLLSVSKLTELLRPETEQLPDSANDLFNEVRCDYDMTVNAIRTYMDNN